MALSEMLGQQEQPQQGTQPQGDPQQAMQQLDMLIQVVQGIKDEQTYQQALQQYQKMGGDVSELNPHYDPQEVAQFLQMLMQAKQELAQHMGG